MPRAHRFFAGVLWNWVGVALNVAIGLLLSPYIARKLGSERYGIWVLVFSLVEYLWFFDLGFNTSVTQFVAKYRARNEPEQINRVISTGLVYFCAVAIVFALATLLVAWRGVELFKIASPVDRQDFRVLILIAGLGWALNFPLHFFSSCLDAFQRYDHITRTWVAQLLIRSVGCALLLYFGFGLRELGVVMVVGQLVGNSLAMLAFRSVFPEMRLSSLYVKFDLVREMWNYGVHSFVANISNLLLNQGAPVMIGHFSGASFVGFYTFPSRLLAYSVEAVTRIGFVTRSNVVEMQAKGDEKAVYSLGIYLNRYCVTLFLPLVIYLLGVRHRTASPLGQHGIRGSLRTPAAGNFAHHYVRRGRAVQFHLNALRLEPPRPYGARPAGGGATRRARHLAGAAALRHPGRRLGGGHVVRSQPRPLRAVAGLPRVGFVVPQLYARASTHGRC